MDVLIFQLLLALTLVLFMLPKKVMYSAAMVLQLSLIGISGTWAVQALFLGQNLSKVFQLTIQSQPLILTIDSLSAYFILVINFTILTGLIYAKGYLAPYHENKSKGQFSLHYFSLSWIHISMLLVVMLRDGIGFLLAWELMSVSSFLLVIFDSRNENTLKIGLNYLVQMHIGFLLILSGFLFTYLATGTMSFDAMAQAFGSLEIRQILGERGSLVLFLLLFVGFGIKAGFIPLHTWLPHAHPAAPSHVSGIMSGIMIKMGIYGILRVLLVIENDLLIIGVFILLISIVSGLYGVMMAIVQHDLKKLLAYHSIENIGIIGMGIGLGVIGKATGNNALMALGFAGGLLHILNHSLFKSLLFYGAGAVYRATHTRDINKLGGLIKSMPKTSLFFLLGAIAISGLPPFNGFISEFLIYSGMFESIDFGSLNSALLFLTSIVALALIGGLALFCFTKAFGMVFLGTGRSAHTDQVSEATSGMLFSKGLIAVLIVAIGVLPMFFVRALFPVVAQFGIQTSVLESYILSGSALTQISMVIGGLLLVFIFIWLIRRAKQKSVEVVYGPTWGCGYTGADPALHQYTATSFADNYKILAKPIVGVEKYDPNTFPIYEEAEIFPGERKFETHSYDKIERNIIQQSITQLARLPRLFAKLQTGEIRHYLIYPLVFILLIFLLTFLNLI